MDPKYQRFFLILSPQRAHATVYPFWFVFVHLAARSVHQFKGNSESKLSFSLIFQPAHRITTVNLHTAAPRFDIPLTGGGVQPEENITHYKNPFCRANYDNLCLLPCWRVSHSAELFLQVCSSVSRSWKKLIIVQLCSWTPAAELDLLQWRSWLAAARKASLYLNKWTPWRTSMMHHLLAASWVLRVVVKSSQLFAASCWEMIEDTVGSPWPPAAVWNMCSHMLAWTRTLNAACPLH